MARWSRAARLLSPDTARVLDLGCAFGFGTRALLPRPCVVGIEVSEKYLRRATREVRGARFLRAVGAALPFDEASFDAVVCLDVLEHVPDERLVLAEIARVLRPGGTLVVSVPHAGLLARFDSINCCPDLWNLDEIAPGRDLVHETGKLHPHFTLPELRAGLGRGFRITGVWRTGLGIAELVNIPLLWVSKRLLRLPRLYDVLQYLYFSVYLAEDLLPMGRAGYHLMVRAVRLEPAVGEGRARA